MTMMLMVLRALYIPDGTEHTVTFKCIGCTKDQQYQDTLTTVAQLCRTGNVVDITINQNLQIKPCQRQSNCVSV